VIYILIAFAALDVVVPVIAVMLSTLDPYVLLDTNKGYILPERPSLPADAAEATVVNLGVPIKIGDVFAICYFLLFFFI
jgi:hypothetical protein